MSKLSAFVRKTKRRVRRFVNRTDLKKHGVLTAPFDPDIYTLDSPDLGLLGFPGSEVQNEPVYLCSSLCTKKQLDSAAFRYWAACIGEPWRLHRKLWEFCFVLQALYERGMLAKGKRGIGFAVGEEPLPAWMASMGCNIVATDLDAHDPRSLPWAQTNQLAENAAKLNKRGLCGAKEFAERVSFRPVDMNCIPQDLVDFDFNWSSCSFEHCGSIELGMRFIREQMKCLKPGGIAVHTTEINLTSDSDTISEGSTVIFRRQDIEAMVRDLKNEGHTVEKILVDLGHSPEDGFVDTFPYENDVHLKLCLFDRYVSTSIALVIRKQS
jgi:SAM-dependent methyltransferase